MTCTQAIGVLCVNAKLCSTSAIWPDELLGFGHSSLVPFSIFLRIDHMLNIRGIWPFVSLHRMYTSSRIWRRVTLTNVVIKNIQTSQYKFVSCLHFFICLSYIYFHIKSTYILRTDNKYLSVYFLLCIWYNITSNMYFLSMHCTCVSLYFMYNHCYIFFRFSRFSFLANWLTFKTWGHIYKAS